MMGFGFVVTPKEPKPEDQGKNFTVIFRDASATGARQKLADYFPELLVINEIGGEVQE